jgi:2-phosphosulfolactate phosphatase
VRKTVVIDCFPESVSRYRDGYAIVAVDVVRATTTAISAAVCGHRCFPVATVEAALELAASLENALLAGEERGIMPLGFDLNNSPTELLARGDFERPVVLVSSSGTKLCHEASKCDTAFLACFRNYRSMAGHLAKNFPKVAVIGAGSRGEFREEDQMCCAWIAELLLDAGYRPLNRETVDIVKRWSNKAVGAWIGNKSAAYLRTTGQFADLEFILEHIADLDAPFLLRDGEVVMCDKHWPAPRPGVLSASR